MADRYSELTEQGQEATRTEEPQMDEERTERDGRMEMLKLILNQSNRRNPGEEMRRYDRLYRK